MIDHAPQVISQKSFCQVFYDLKILCHNFFKTVVSGFEMAQNQRSRGSLFWRRNGGVGKEFQKKFYI